MLPRRSKAAVDCWLAAALLLAALALYWLVTWLLLPGDPQKCHLGQVYARIDTTMTLDSVQALVGRPPDDSPEPPGSMLWDYRLLAPGIGRSLGASASWLEKGNSLLVYYTTSDKRVRCKSLSYRLANNRTENYWQRLLHWFSRLFR
jgi:hypothetical protein